MDNLLLTNSLLIIAFLTAVAITTKFASAQIRIVLTVRIAVLYSVVSFLVGFWSARYDINWLLQHNIFGPFPSGLLVSGLAFWTMLIFSRVQWWRGLIIAGIPHAILFVLGDFAALYL